MRFLRLAAAFVLAASTSLLAQVATTHISTGSTLPTTCRVGDAWYKTGTSAGLYMCTATNTWTISAAGTVTASGTLTANSLILGGGTTVISALGSLGTTSTLLHGNAAGAPTFGAVALTTDVSGVLPGVNGGAGTANGILKANGSGTVSAATSGTDYAPATSGSLPLFGNGSGGFTNGTVQGNTTKVTTYAGSAPATNDCAKFDSNGNVTTAGAACGSGGGGGTTYNLGSLVLLASQTASSSASLDFVNRTATGQSGAIFQADYDHYYIEFINIVPATDNVNFAFRTSTDGGATYTSAGGSYFYGAQWANNSPATGTLNDLSASSTYALIGDSVDNNGGAAGLIGVSGWLDIWSPTAATQHKYYADVAFFANSNTNAHEQVAGWVTGAASVNAIRFLQSSGNIASGTIRVYGVANQATTTTPTGGSLILRETQTASSSSELAFTSCFDSNYDTYQIEYQNLYPATNATALRLQMSTNGGSSYDSTAANYRMAGTYALANSAGGGSGGGSLIGNNGGVGYIQVGIEQTVNSGNYADNGSFRITGTTSTTRNKAVFGQYNGVDNRDGAGVVQNVLFSGVYANTTAINAFRLYYSSGNIASGTARCYAVSNTVPSLGPMNFMVANGRLTTESGVPVSTSDRTSQSTIYWTPYQGNQLGLYTSGVWGVLSVSETSLTLSGLTSGKNYDVFGYSNAGTLALELSAAWSSDTARTDAVSLQDGIYVKTSDKSRRLLGTIRTTGTTTVEDSAAKRFVWNVYNRAQRPMANATETTNSWNITSTSYGQANSNAANQLMFVVGLVDQMFNSTVYDLSSNSTNGQANDAGIGVNSTTVNSATHWGFAGSSTNVLPQTVTYNGYPGLGYNFIAWLERVQGGTGTFYGDAGLAFYQSGIVGSIWN